MAAVCPYCGNPAALVRGSWIYQNRHDLAEKLFWWCKPCDARVGCHPESQSPLGPLANAETRKARAAAHSSFDPLWKAHMLPRIKGMSGRSAAYLWLSRQTGIPLTECHIGHMDVDVCQKVVDVCDRFRKKMVDDAG